MSIYELHGLVTLIAWFPLGFLLLATQRYYKTQWFLMHHIHSIIGFVVVATTVITCFHVYSYVDW